MDPASAVDRRGLGLAVAAVILAADQASKEWLIGLMAANPNGIEVAPFLDLVMFWNRGVSFGLLSDHGDLRRWLLIGVSALITLWLVIWLWRRPKTLVALALGLVIGGAVGNVIDRVRFGAVADFFYFHLGPYYWPAFNLADSAIVCGVALMLFDSLFERGPPSE